MEHHEISAIYIFFVFYTVSKLLFGMRVMSNEKKHEQLLRKIDRC